MASSSSQQQGIPDSIDFHHPYTPYDVQNEFMRTVYKVLQTGEGQIGILESPTGTVGYLNLLGAVFRWG
jgi:chromosome transmission fidelity protein 1